MAERLALPTSDHGVAGSNPAGGEILPEPKRRFLAQSLSCSPSHRLEMTEKLLKGRKTLTHPSMSCYNNLLIIYGVNQRSFSKSAYLHLCYAASLILTSTVPGVTVVTTDVGPKRVWPLNDTFLLVFERPLIKRGTCSWSFQNCPRWSKIFLQTMFCPASSNCWATSGGAMLARCLSFARNRFGFTNLRSYCSNSKFYDVFKQDKCPSIDFKRVCIG